MRTAEPGGQQPGRFRRRRSIKRHERGRDAGDAHDVRAPAILGNPGDFDQIGASPDGFFETMDGVGHQMSARSTSSVERRAFSPASRARSSEDRDESASTLSVRNLRRVQQEKIHFRASSRMRSTGICTRDDPHRLVFAPRRASTPRRSCDIDLATSLDASQAAHYAFNIDEQPHAGGRSRDAELADARRPRWPRTTMRRCCGSSCVTEPRWSATGSSRASRTA